ncbi:MAG: hypothetical protein ACE5K0_11675 [Candidatus Methanofastidiosia archaeon]
MPKKKEDRSKKPDVEVRDGSLINLPPGKIYEESLTPLEVHWVALPNLYDVMVGNYLSIILFGISTALFGAYFASSDETQKNLFAVFCIIFFLVSAFVQIYFVYLKIRKWKKEAIKRGDVK